VLGPPLGFVWRSGRPGATGRDPMRDGNLTPFSPMWLQRSPADAIVINEKATIRR
jgi:hypothetical protein